MKYFLGVTPFRTYFTKISNFKQKTLPDALVDDDSNGVLGHVEHTAGTSVVHLMGHTLLEGTVGLDVNDVSSAVAAVIGGEMLYTVLAEVTREHVARSAPNTLGVNHL